MMVTVPRVYWTDDEVPNYFNYQPSNIQFSSALTLRPSKVSVHLANCDILNLLSVLLLTMLLGVIEEIVLALHLYIVLFLRLIYNKLTIIIKS